MKNIDIFLSAITGKGDVNVGYLVMLRGAQVCGLIIACIVLGETGEFIWGESTTTVGGVVTVTKHVFNTMRLAQATGLVVTAYGLTFLTGVAAFMWGDSHNTPPAMVQTTTSTTTATVPQAGPQ